MGVELRPLGVNCNIGCQYCYQNPQRDAGNLTKAYDLEAMKAAVIRDGGSFILFGGEPLLMPEDDLEALWAWGLERFGKNGIQTNGILINDNHIRMFKQYRVHVGISIDGPGELNDARWAGSLEKTRQATAKTEAIIERLCREGVVPSLIVTLHRTNASAERLPALNGWFRSLDDLGITSARLHILEVETGAIRQRYALSVPENIAALINFSQLEPRLPRLRFDVFADMEKLMIGQDANATCVWMACDPYTTSAVHGVEGHGQSSNCGRTNKDGIDFTKADVPGYERYIALYHTPQEHGGCQGCRFFLMCKGQCPGTALNGDWRNRTEHCEVWMQLFRQIEDRLLNKGVFPISVQQNRGYLERAMLGAWAAGANPTMQQTLTRMRAIHEAQQ
jgi:uncharacterized protein